MRRVERRLVYILESQAEPTRHYIGIASNPHTNKNGSGPVSDFPCLMTLEMTLAANDYPSSSEDHSAALRLLNRETVGARCTEGEMSSLPVAELDGSVEADVEQA
jgi:hypothetical protein